MNLKSIIVLLLVIGTGILGVSDSSLEQCLAT